MLNPDVDALLHRSRRRARRTLLIGLLVVLLVAGGAVGAWYGLAARGEQPAAAGETPLVTATVERRTMRDTITVRGVARYAEVATLRASGTGVITQVGVIAGTVVTPGTVLYRVAGRPVIAVTGTFPFWRDIGPGTTGVDVKQLEASLKAAGYGPGPVDETFTDATERAIKQWQKASKLDDTGVLRAEEVMAAAWPARVGKVDIKVGDPTSPGTQVFAITAPSTAVALDLTPGQRLRVQPGQRVEIEVTSTKTKATGTIRDVSTAPTTNTQSGNGGGDSSGGQSGNGQQGSSAPTYQAGVNTDAPLDVVDGTQLGAVVVLAEERDVLTVPVGAVTQDGAGRPVVRVVEPGGAARQTGVELGIQSGAYVAVRSGLSAGQTVALGGGR